MNIESNRFFTAFSEKARRRLLALAQCESYEDGVCLFEEGDAPDGVYLLLAGGVELTKDAGDGRIVVIARVSAGEYFGEMGVIDGCGRSAGARAVGEARLAKIPAAPLLEILRDEPSDVSLQILRRLSEYLRATNTRFVTEILRKEKMQMIGEMAGNIIHDFKNPICNILIAAELMREEMGGTATTDYFKMIERQVERMVAMSQELLDYSQGRSHLDRNIVTVEELFKEIELLNADYLRKNNVEFVFKPVNASLEVDKDRIIRVLQNLLSNAVEVLGPSDGKIIFRAEKLDDDTVELCVIDNGPGIPEEIRDVLFEPFVTRGKRRGTGLGMAIAKANIEAHGGTISFSSEKGQGTTFVVRLPMVAVPPREEGER